MFDEFSFIGSILNLLINVTLFILIVVGCIYSIMVSLGIIFLLLGFR